MFKSKLISIQVRQADILLACLAAFSFLVVSLTFQDSLLRDSFCAVKLCFTSPSYQQWNDLFYSLAVGTLVSVIFYIVVVRIPESKSRKVIKDELRLRYRQLKEDCILNFLFMSTNHSAPWELVQKLTDFQEFRKFFKSPHPNYDDHWYAVLNNVEEQYLESIASAVLTLKHEIEFALLKLNISDDEALGMLRQLTYLLDELSRTEADYESEKRFGRLMWSIFAEFDFVDGSRDHDLIARMIDRL